MENRNYLLYREVDKAGWTKGIVHVYLDVELEEMFKPTELELLRKGRKVYQTCYDVKRGGIYKICWQDMVACTKNSM